MFNSGGNGYSLADIAAATGGNRSNSGDDWGGNGSWWIIVLFLFCFMGGWNRDGFGSGNNGGGYSSNGGFIPMYQGTTTREEVAYGFDMNNLENGIRGIQNGLCDGFYALNTGLLNGFAANQNNVNLGFSGLNGVLCNLGNTLERSISDTGIEIQQAINASNIANMQNTNALTTQLNNMAFANKDCCCQTQRLIESNFADLNYNLATQSCQTRQAIADSSRDIIDSQQAGTRAILDFLTQDKIASLTAENQSLKFAASQAAQNNYLVHALNPAPVPSYQVPNPYTGICGLQNQCCCNSYIGG